ncbi:acyltransferase [Variovorax dokdonensis]|uniref:Acyltransferase n=1 Tax=Variovorax dokdonensis TaxID=344883 RepID=A0ABT7N8A2_9BURK|nr:acyltransferase [Variovorax dokdonensis]MDM0044173.1 acyltransferase [Variovorax dokdonensis]
MTLDERAVGRSNNLNLLRLIAAWIVLASHSFVLATGDIHAEPWQTVLGTTPGGIAVDVFFVISGFLVTGSLLRSKSIWEFAIARALRIYPALWVSLLLTVGIIGIGFSAEPTSQYFTQLQTWKYLLKNALMVAGAEADLPGAFFDNKAPAAVNGSLWTLRHELRLYALLGIGWLFLAVTARHRHHDWMRRASLVIAIALIVASLRSPQHSTSPEILKLAVMFCSGMVYQLFRSKIPLSPMLFGAASIFLVGGAMNSPMVFRSIYLFALPYVTLFIAYWPANKALLKFNEMGDYSYGIYIYAFPIQQMLMATMPTLSVCALTAAATFFSVVVAMMSWHFIEEPAILQKHRLTKKIKPMNKLASIHPLNQPSAENGNQ